MHTYFLIRKGVGVWGGGSRFFFIVETPKTLPSSATVPVDQLDLVSCIECCDSFCTIKFSFKNRNTVLFIVSQYIVSFLPVL